VLERCRSYDFRSQTFFAVVGYFNNAAIAEQLGELPLTAGEDKLVGNLYVCYQKLIEMGIIPSRELDLLEAWIADVCALLETAVAAGSDELRGES